MDLNKAMESKKTYTMNPAFYELYFCFSLINFLINIKTIEILIIAIVIINFSL